MTHAPPSRPPRRRRSPDRPDSGRGAVARRALAAAALGACALGGATDALAGSRLLATGGATSVEGSAGGGLVPWAPLAGYAEFGEAGATAFASAVRTDDVALDVTGAAVALDNRVELSVARQRLDIDAVIPGETLEQAVLGMKLRLGGELPWSDAPQLSLGVQVKRLDEGAVPLAVGASRTAGVDVYLAASKLWLDGPFGRHAFANATLRATNANQGGLLGFGTAGDRGHELVAEASAGLFLNRHWVIGAEYRQKPDRLGFATEDDWKDVFVAWFPNKAVSVVAAWADLGSIAGLDGQSGAYLSLEVSR